MWKLIIGIAGMALVYSQRPPSGFGDALMMMGSGRQWYLKEPFFLAGMAIFALLAIFGLLEVLKKR
jgi:hypothetical protein